MGRNVGMCVYFTFGPHAGLSACVSCCVKPSWSVFFYPPSPNPLPTKFIFIWAFRHIKLWELRISKWIQYMWTFFMSDLKEWPFPSPPVEGWKYMYHVWRDESIPRVGLYICNGVRCGTKCTVFFLLLLTIYLIRYFYYTLVRLSL